MFVLATLLSPLLALSQESSSLPGPFRTGEDSCWSIEQAGERIGQCVSRYEGEVSLGGLRTHHFRDQVRLELPVPSGKLEQRFTVELWTDADGHPLRFDFRAQLADVKSSVEGVLAGGKAELVVCQGPSEKTLSVAAPAEAYLLANNFVSQLELVLAGTVARASGSESHSVTLFSANALSAFPYGLKRVEASGGTSVYEDSLGERLHVSGGRLTLVEIPSQTVAIRRVEEPVERFTIELSPKARAPEDLEREEVKIADGAVSLAGTITRKKGLVEKGSSGRLPAVFFLSGSGGQDREGYSSGLDLGTHEILDRLTRAGFLTLRVDDRGVGGSTGPLEGITFEDLVEDGRRAVRFLLARPDVDPQRVALIGHSEGGLSGPVLAASEPIAALVLMAAPGRPLEDLLREQLLLGKKLGGADAAVLATFGGEIDGFLDALARGEALEAGGIPAELALFLPARAWLASHLGRDPLPFLRRVTCPILILQGGGDVQVSAQRDAPQLVAALDAAGHEDHELLLFPTLDHLFKLASDPPSELDYIKSRPVDVRFLDALANWLSARLIK